MVLAAMDVVETRLGLLQSHWYYSFPSYFLGDSRSEVCLTSGYAPSYQQRGSMKNGIDNNGAEDNFQVHGASDRCEILQKSTYSMVVKVGRTK